MTRIDFALLDSVAKDYFDDQRVLAMVKELWRTSALHKAARQALGVLNSGPDVDPIFFDETLAALRAALADTKVDSQAITKQPSPPPEAQTEAEKIAYCAGWWACLAKAKASSTCEPLPPASPSQT